MGHSHVLSMRRSGTKLHLLDDKQIRVSSQHDHNHNPEVCKHRGILCSERESIIVKTMGMCVNGVWWFVLPNLPEMEEAAESAEKEEDLMLRLGRKI